MDEAEVISILKSLPRLDPKEDGFHDAIRRLRIFSESNSPLGEQLLARVLEYLIRTNAKSACSASIELRMALEEGLISIETVMEILERWEKDPVPSIDPNLGACVYEHLIADQRYAARFSKWKYDELLRKRYIEIGFALPSAQEIELYEWAISVNETESVALSLEVFGSERAFSDASLKTRWEKILKATTRLLTPPTRDS